MKGLVAGIQRNRRLIRGDKGEDGISQKSPKSLERREGKGFGKNLPKRELTSSDG